jgi:hypothetical protein
MYRRTTSFSVLLISFTGSDGSSVALSSVWDGGGVCVCERGGRKCMGCRVRGIEVVGGMQEKQIDDM